MSQLPFNSKKQEDNNNDRHKNRPEGMESLKCFLGLKNAWNQPEPLMCMPTCIKVLLDNQFPKKRIGFSRISNCMRYRVRIPNLEQLPFYSPKPREDAVESLNSCLNKAEYNLTAIHKEFGKIDQLKNLLLMKKYIIIFVNRVKYLGESTDVNVVEENDIDEHTLLLCGFDEGRRSFMMFDPLPAYYWKHTKNYTEPEIPVLEYKKLLEVWESHYCPFMWIQELDEAQRKLQHF
jgi:hypothetical protein